MFVTLFWPSFSNRIFFQILLQMHLCPSTLSQISLKYSFWKVFFLIFGHVNFFEKGRFVLYMVVLGAFAYGASSVPKFLRKSTQRGEGQSFRNVSSKI